MYIYEHFYFNVIISADEDNKVETFGINYTALVWFTQYNMASQSNVTHKYQSSDMPEIRFIRGKLLKAHKLEQKVERLDRVTKAIVGDINYKMLGLCSSDDPCMQDMLDALDASIVKFRETLQDDLHGIIMSKALDLQDEAEASPDAIYRAASDMANKYIKRQKSTNKRSKKSTAKTHDNRQETTSTKKTPTKTAKTVRAPDTPAKAPTRDQNVHNPEPKAPKTSIAKPLRTAVQDSQTTTATDVSTATRSSRSQQHSRSSDRTRVVSTKSKKTSSVTKSTQPTNSIQPSMSSVFPKVKNNRNVRSK